MIDVESLCDQFKLGGIDKIIISIYSYFLVGFFILFTTYEQRFLGLELHIQTFLAMGISFPISVLFTGLLENFDATIDEESDGNGFFYQSAGASVIASIWYIGFFSLFYIIKHIEIINYNNEFDQIFALIIILSGFVFAYITNK